MTIVSMRLEGYELCSAEHQGVLDQLLDTFFLGINERDAQLCSACYADSAVIQTKDGEPLNGKAGIEALVQRWLDASSSATITPVSVKETESDLLSVEWTGSIVLTDCIKGLSPTGEEVKFSGTTHFRVKEGEVVEHFAEVDYSGFPVSTE